LSTYQAPGMLLLTLYPVPPQPFPLFISSQLLPPLFFLNLPLPPKAYIKPHSLQWATADNKIKRCGPLRATKFSAKAHSAVCAMVYRT
jgi:hypothetical protein